MSRMSWRLTGAFALAHVALTLGASPSSGPRGSGTTPARSRPSTRGPTSAGCSPAATWSRWPFSCNPEIAHALEPSLKTVQNHVSRILTKLRVRDRTQAALRMRGW